MRREYEQSAPPPQPTEVYLSNVYCENNTVIDHAVNVNYPWGTTSDGLWFTNGNTTNRAYYIYANGGYKSVYINRSIKWNTSTPNPPANGVCPEYFGFGLRFKTMFYSTTHTGDKEPLSCLSHNNTAYRGYCLIWINNSGWCWALCKNSYNPVASSVTKIQIPYVETQSSPMIIQWDFNATQNRFKAFDNFGNLLADSGVDTSLHSNERVLQLMCGNWNSGNQCNPTCYFKYIQFIDGTSVDDFLQ